MAGKNTTRASWRGWRPSWTLVWVECDNQMQVAQGHGLVRDCALVQAAFGCCILLLVPKVVFTLCNLLPDDWKRIAFIHNSTAALPNLAQNNDTYCHVDIQAANGYFGRCCRPWHPDEIAIIRLVEVIEWFYYAKSVQLKCDCRCGSG